jgi:hypothetical protein
MGMFALDDIWNRVRRLSDDQPVKSVVVYHQK